MSDSVRESVEKILMDVDEDDCPPVNLPFLMSLASAGVTPSALELCGSRRESHRSVLSRRFLDAESRVRSVWLATRVSGLVHRRIN